MGRCSQVFLRVWKTALTLTRYSSLSAIHRGLRESEKARPQGFQAGALKTEDSSRITSAKRGPSRSRRGQDDWAKPDYKIKRGKKDITDQGPQPKSRKARFHDPTEGFGKKSLVYQLKHGALRDQLASMTTDETSGGDSRPSRGRGHGDRFDQGGFESRRSETSSVGERDSGRTGDFEPRRSERFGSDRFRGSRDARPEGQAREDRYFQPREDNPTRERFPPEGEKSDYSFRKSPPRDDMPIRIHHTTAASQFLYGRSVVEAALKNSRRQLYRLYVYSGEDRQNLAQDAHLERLASQKDVEITKVADQNGLRMMDKMSGGRPHNGCILEASPLPQLPLKGLGAMSEDPAKPGFSIELTHQSVEDALVNGTSDFISYRTRGEQKPFILLLDGILDPGNLGAILRTAAFLGITGVVITKHSSATLSPVALKASAAASEVLPLYSITSTVDFLERSKESGWMTYAAVPSGPRSRGNSHITLDRLESYDPLSTQPTILVVGSEGEGLNRQVRRIVDFEVSIPSYSGLLSVVDSLNVSVATGILCSAFLKKSQNFEIDESADKQEEGNQLW
ncbi:uncharacterized protein BCR38DRAFT_341928 [Pseudomassariella vexata]|uniref:rRNA methyltransferase 1, mitochondrial n=1 Tax=Pseudomassariella vexata TaxID=1141098 RepID=A0A1Y2E271_9PEZI|nr:uncharacterized protein BCR38DRAFT_341928 [Pseudomassariella vexata]ORY65416.1 hypothetical protein BCR38DRAFT_341928 [Pseudomassariella vexata]